MLWDPQVAPEHKTLKQLRRTLVTPEGEMRDRLARIYTTSASPLARDLAGTLKDLVPETFSGIYGNANKDTRWLSTSAYADLVSGSSFRIRDLADGRLTVFVQVPLTTLQATPALGRVIVGALLNAAYEADGRVRGRILFLLDEVARLGYMGVLEQARDAGRKYGITLLLLYQSLGQLIGQWGREGKQAWYDATSWRLPPSPSSSAPSCSPASTSCGSGRHAHPRHRCAISASRSPCWKKRPPISTCARSPVRISRTGNAN